MSTLTRDKLAARMMPHAAYEVDIPWQHLERHLADELKAGLDLDPDYQREHVWTEDQRVAWVEHVLTGGEFGKLILVGHTGTRAHAADASGRIPDYSLVDGKQRMATVRRLLRDDLAVFPDPEKPEGYVWSEIADDLKRIYIGRFQWRLVVVPTRADLLRLYLKLNAGGTPHTRQELARVEQLLEQERGR